MFYISSRGSSATIWLAKALSQHSDIVCFGPSRSFPPVIPGTLSFGNRKISEVSPDYFISSLVECERACENQKFFGSIHGYHGISAKQACEDHNGYFSYITRHPVDRIHSAFIYYACPFLNESGISIRNRDVSKFISELFSREDVASIASHLYSKSSSRSKLSHTKFIAKSILPSTMINVASLAIRRLKTIGAKNHNIFTPCAGLTESELGSRLFTIFCALVDSFFNYDRELQLNCDNSQGIKMEEMVASKTYFKEKVLDYSVPGLSVSKDYLDSIFEQGRHNVHRDKPVATHTAWDSLPGCMRDAFIDKFNFYGIEDVCAQFDYKVPFNL